MDAKQETIKRDLNWLYALASHYWQENGHDLSDVENAYENVLNAYESLQRIAELPERFQLIAGAHHEQGAKGSDLVVAAYVNCADELQQALPESLRSNERGVE